MAAGGPHQEAGPPSDQGLKELRGTLDLAWPRVLPGQSGAPRVVGEKLPQSRIVKQLAYLRHKATDIARLNQEAEFTVVHHVRYALGRAGDRRHAAGHGLENHHAKGFLAGRYDQDVGRLIGAYQLLAAQPAAEFDVLRDPTLACQPLVVGQLVTVADDSQVHITVSPLKLARYPQGNL